MWVRLLQKTAKCHRSKNSPTRHTTIREADEKRMGLLKPTKKKYYIYYWERGTARNNIYFYDKKKVFFIVLCCGFFLFSSSNINGNQIGISDEHGKCCGLELQLWNLASCKIYFLDSFLGLNLSFSLVYFQTLFGCYFELLFGVFLDPILGVTLSFFLVYFQSLFWVLL